MKRTIGSVLGLMLMSACETQVVQGYMSLGRDFADGDVKAVANDSIEWHDVFVKTTPDLVPSILRERSDRASMEIGPMATFKISTDDGHKALVRKHPYVGNVAADGVITLSDGFVEAKHEVPPSLVRSAIADGSGVMSDSLIGTTPQKSASHVSNTMDQQRMKYAVDNSGSSADDNLDANVTVSMLDDDIVMSTFMANLIGWARPQSSSLARIGFLVIVSVFVCAGALTCCVLFSSDDEESRDLAMMPQRHTRPSVGERENSQSD